MGGNAYDHFDAAGVLVHSYGPHIFHTQSKDVFDYLSRYPNGEITSIGCWLP